MPNAHADRRTTPPENDAADLDATADVAESASALDAADAAFRLLCMGPQPLALDCSRLGHGLPRRPVPLTELRDLVLDRQTAHAAQEAIWRELVSAAQTDDAAWVVGAVGMALPGLRNAARKLAAGYPGDVDDLTAEMLAGFTARLKAIDPDAGRLGPRLVWAAQRAGAKLRAAEWDYAARVVLRRESFEPPDPQHGHEDLVLAEAVRDGALTEFEATLIGSTRLEDIHVAEAADALGLSYWQVYRAREKAEAALLSYLNVSRPERKTRARGKKAA